MGESQPGPSASGTELDLAAISERNYDRVVQIFMLCMSGISVLVAAAMIYQGALSKNWFELAAGAIIFIPLANYFSWLGLIKMARGPDHVTLNDGGVLFHYPDGRVIKFGWGDTGRVLRIIDYRGTDWGGSTQITLKHWFLPSSSISEDALSSILKEAEKKGKTVRTTSIRTNHGSRSKLIQIAC